jgi:hypothetical protein
MKNMEATKIGMRTNKTIRQLFIMGLDCKQIREHYNEKENTKLNNYINIYVTNLRKSEVLNVFRERKSSYNQITTLKDLNGKVKVIFKTMLNQPKYDQEAIEVKGKTYILNWENVEKTK